jgi:hypothetical protein
VHNGVSAPETLERAPLTPSGCDIRSFPYMPLEVTLRDSNFFAVCSAEEFKAAVSLWCASWHQVPAASLPNEERVLARLAAVGLGRWRRIRQRALYGFVLCSDGRLYHPVIAVRALDAWAIRLRQQSRASGRHRREREAREAAAKQGIAAAMPRQSHSNARDWEVIPPKPPHLARRLPMS